jgi:hypothetical protein
MPHWRQKLQWLMNNEQKNCPYSVKMNQPIFFVFTLFLLFFACKNTSNSQVTANKPNKIAIKGLNFVAPPDSFARNPMPDVSAVNAEWIAVIPYAYTMPNEPSVKYNIGKWQWFGERPEGVLKTIKMAHQQGLKVMLKPQVYCPQSWTGALDFDTEAKWQAWEKDYIAYVMLFVKMAAEQNVEMICIGTEFKISVQKRPFFWQKLIENIRKNYNGKLTYAANWDEYATIPFWESLDFIGVNAYFPLTNEKTPTIASLQKLWQKPLDEMEKLHRATKKDIIFTEFGYLSVDSCAYMGWELEKNVQQRNINEQAQANAIAALLSSAAARQFWRGGFLWKWFPNGEGHEGYVERDYTPQGKKAHEVLKKYYE